MNSIYKNSVQKIVFKSGRIQTFSESTSFKKVESVNDYENVSLTQVEGEVRGLYKIGEVSAKAKGATGFSNQERVKERAYRKFKIQAAIMGANVIYLTNQRTEGNKWGNNGSSAETNLTGVAYSNVIPNFDEFKKVISAKRSFEARLRTSLWSNGTDMTQTDIVDQFSIFKITNENGLIMLDGELEGVSRYSRFRVVSFNNEYFNIFYEDNSTVYNIAIKINP